MFLPVDVVAQAVNFNDKLAIAAISRTSHQIRYDGSYYAISYPGGDVAPDIGVCSDVVIRSYRALGIDLQQLIHEDMIANFAAYPKIWNLKRPDTNIDHRRVPNLQTFFERNGQSFRVSNNDKTGFQPGDIVSWMLPGNKPHIGMVSNRKSPDTKTLMIVHNIGLGPRLEDVLFAWPITGWYRYQPTIYDQSATANAP